MSGQRIPDAFLAELRDRTPLADLIGRTVPLRRQGRFWKGLCPFHGERNPSFAVYRNGFHCFGCGVHGDAVGWLMRAGGMSFLDAVRTLAAEAGMEMPDGSAPHGVARPEMLRPAAPRSDIEADDEDAHRRGNAALALFLRACPSLAGTPAAAYLLARGIDLAALGRQPRALRFHPSLYNRESGRSWPALLAAVSDGAGAHTATHRTWLARDAAGVWRKAPLREPKMSLGRVRGGSIRLWRGGSRRPLAEAPPDEPVVIAEGIETALSVAAACPHLRVLAAVSLGNIGAVWLPEQVRTVIIAADNDMGSAAQRELQRAVNLHLAAGREVRLARSPVGKDFNDALVAA